MKCVTSTKDVRSPRSKEMTNHCNVSGPTSRRVVLQYGNATLRGQRRKQLLLHSCHRGLRGSSESLKHHSAGRLFHNNEEVAPRPIRLLPWQQSGRSVKMNAHLYVVSRSGIHARNISNPSVVFITQGQLHNLTLL